MLLALIDDKAFTEILEIIAPIFASITVTEPLHDHPIPGTRLQSELIKLGRKAIFIKDINKAFDFIKKGLAENDTLFVLGSHFLIGNLRGF